MRAKLRGKTYKVKFRPIKAKHTLAYCEKETNRIVLDPRIHNSRIVEVVLHEALHACFWDLTEEAVDGAAKDLAALLKKMNLVKKSYSRKAAERK